MSTLRGSSEMHATTIHSPQHTRCLHHLAQKQSMGFWEAGWSVSYLCAKGQMRDGNVIHHDIELPCPCCQAVPHLQ